MEAEPEPEPVERALLLEAKQQQLQYLKRPTAGAKVSPKYAGTNCTVS
jgi:hypothetical protein